MLLHVLPLVKDNIFWETDSLLDELATDVKFKLNLPLNFIVPGSVIFFSLLLASDLLKDLYTKVG